MIFSQKNFSIHFWKCAFFYVLTSSVVTFAQSGSLAKYSRFEKEPVFINKIDRGGAIFCKEVKEDVSLFNKASQKINLHILPPLNDQHTLTGLKIILRATDQLMQYPEAVYAFRRAAARWERVISTPITTVLDVDFGPTWFNTGFGEKVLGGTSPATYYALKPDNTNATVIDIVLKLIELKPENPQLKALYSAIPIPTLSTVPSTLERGIGTLMNLQALGFIEPDISADPNFNHFGSVPAIGFNSNYSFDFDPSDGIASGKYDFDATCVHEIGHALGFLSAVGFSDHKGLPDLYYPWDLFRVRPEAVASGSLVGFSTTQRVTTAGPVYSSLWSSEGGVDYYFSNHVFFDGLEKVELSTADGEMLNGDGRQSSHWRDDNLRPPSLGINRRIGIMDPTLPSASRWMVNDNDLRMLEVIGYTVNYNPRYANLLLLHDQDTLNLAKSLDTLKFVDVNLNSRQQIQYQLINLSLDNLLLYEFEIIFNDIQPEFASLLYDAKSGSVGIGKSEPITVSLLTLSQPASFLGTIRMKTNDINNPVIDIPFELTTGGAIAPKIYSSVASLGNFSFIDGENVGVKTKTFALSNLGNLPLDCSIYITLSTKSNRPTGFLKTNTKNSNLQEFYGNNVSIGEYTYFSTDFEGANNLGGFKQVSTNQGEWTQTSQSAALRLGHSKPMAIHFGKDVDGVSSYDNFSTGLFYSPEFYYNIAPEDAVAISFKYYNMSDQGDIVSFLGSKDSKRTWLKLASSITKGIIKSQSIAWETVLFRFPDLSKFLSDQHWTHFAFHFTSDESIVDQGFFLDDFEISVLSGLNPIYTDIDWKRLPALNSSQNIVLNVNGNLLSGGFYSGNVSIISNDVKNPSLTIPFTISIDKLNKAAKGTLYASTESDNVGKVIKINTLTGEGKEVGSSGFSALRSISLNPKTGELFGFYNSPDKQTSVVKIDGVNGWGFYKFTSPLPLSAMAFTPSGELLGIAPSPPSGKFKVVTQRLYKFNVVTGDTTYLSTLKIKAAAMAIEPATGDIWITVDATEDKDKIYKIDATTGDTTFIGRAEIGNHTIKALAFDNYGFLWGAFGEEKEISTIIKISKSMGLASVVGTTNFKGLTGLAFGPDPAMEVDDEQLTPTSYALFNNYPNPFNPSTVISYQLPENSFVILKVFDVLGNEVESLVNEYQTAGIKNVILDLKVKEFSSGIYFYQLKAGNFCQTKKMLLLK